MGILAVESNIQHASTLPSSFYTSLDWFNLSKDKIFARTWQFCLSDETLETRGQVVPITLLPGMLDEPILFARHDDGSLHCVSNVCTHRANVLIDQPCVTNQLRCRYHGRQFTLCGDFVHMPAFEEAKQFPTAKDHLPKVPFNKLGHWLFASLTPSSTFQDVFSDVKKRLNWLPFHELTFDASRSRDYLVNCHWALYVENYLEGLHIPFVHPALRSSIDFAKYKTELNHYSVLQLAYAKQEDDSFDLPSHSPDYGQAVAAYYFWLFPNTMLNVYPWGCSVSVVKPISPTQTKVSFLTYVLDDTKLGQGAGADVDLVEREDEAIVESVQQGVSSRLYQGGRYSPSMEQGIHHFHRLISEFMNR